MKINMNEKTTLTDEHGNLFEVIEKDGVLWIAENGNRTKEILQDGLYHSDGLKNIRVKDGKAQLPKSQKKGVQPLAQKIKVRRSTKPGVPPLQARKALSPIAAKMKQGREKRTEEINKLRMEGII